MFRTKIGELLVKHHMPTRQVFIIDLIQSIRSEITAAMPEKRELPKAFFPFITENINGYNKAIDETLSNLLQRFGVEGGQEKDCPVIDTHGLLCNHTTCKTCGYNPSKEKDCHCYAGGNYKDGSKQGKVRCNKCILENNKGVCDQCNREDLVSCAKCKHLKKVHIDGICYVCKAFGEVCKGQGAKEL